MPNFVKVTRKTKMSSDYRKDIQQAKRLLNVNSIDEIQQVYNQSDLLELIVFGEHETHYIVFAADLIKALSSDNDNNQHLLTWVREPKIHE